MQLNKVLKGLLLALPVLAVAACSSNKSANNDQSGMGAGAGTGMETAAATCLPKNKLVCRCKNCRRTTSFTSAWTSMT